MFLVCGEALFDFFLETEAGPAAATYAARAGGSPFNVAIGLARLGQPVGPADRALDRPARASGWRGCWSDEGVSTAYAIPTDRPTTISLVGLDAAGVPAYQFYDNGSADTGVTPADLPALGPEIVGPALRLLLDRRGAGRRRAAPRSRARQPRPLHHRSTPTCGRRSSPTWTSGARGWRCCCRSPTWSRSAPRTWSCCIPGLRAESLRRRPDRPAAPSWSWSPTAARRRAAGRAGGAQRRGAAAEGRR